MGLRFLVGTVAVALGVGIAVVVLADNHARYPVLSVVLTLVVGWAFVGAGLVAWRRRPDSRVGGLMCAVGGCWLLTLLVQSNNEWLFPIGAVLIAAPLALYGHLLLAFPGGRLESRAARIVVAASYLDMIAVSVVGILLIPDLQCPGCPANRLAVLAHPDAGRVLTGGQYVVGLALIVAIVVILASRWRRASRARRHVMAPMLATALILFLAEFALVVAALGAPDPYHSALVLVLRWIFAFAAVASALGCLVGLVRSSLDRAGVIDLIVQLGQAVPPGELRQALAAALHDPSLSVLYWIAEQGRFVDSQGRPAVLPTAAEHSPGRAATLLERDGTRIAALVHDPVLGDDPHLLQAVCTTAGIALDNERLQAELRARLDELAAAKLLTNPAAAGALLGEARATLNTALQELRELSRGIHPSRLAEHGLGAALEELVWATPLPVALHCRVDGRLAELVETTAYYVVAEALTNIVKHAEATSAPIEIHQNDLGLVVSVVDDGHGGADPARGSGLAGLADRVHAVGGTLDMTSAPSRGTTLTARLPSHLTPSHLTPSR